MDRRDDGPVVVVEREGGVGAFLFGIVLGAGLALLLAPRSGEELRRELRNQGRRLRATASEKAEDLREVLSGGYEETKLKVEQGIRSARDAIEDKRDGAKEAVEAGKAAVHSARDELERRLADARAARGRRDPEPEDEADDEA